MAGWPGPGLRGCGKVHILFELLKHPVPVQQKGLHLKHSFENLLKQRGTWSSSFAGTPDLALNSALDISLQIASQNTETFLWQKLVVGPTQSI